MDQFTDEELCLIDKWGKEREEVTNAELNSLMDKLEKEEKEALIQTYDQAEERGQLGLILQPTSQRKIMCSIATEPSQMLPTVYAILDVGTTGLERKEDRIIQIGVVKVDNNVVTPWMTYVNPYKPRKEQMGAYNVHRMSTKFLEGKPTFADVAPKLCKFLENIDYVVCYNCIFDWDFLMAEFDRLQDNEESKALMKKIKWIDLFRFAIKSFPGLNNHELSTLLAKFSIRTQKAQMVLYLYKSFFTAGDQEECEVLSLFEQGEKENWEETHHDAVCDSLDELSLLKKLLEKNGYSNITDLVNNFPQCLIDTELFLALEVKLKERKTSNEELMPFATRAEKFYCTTPSLRGHTLADLSVEKIEFALQSWELDKRVRLIYRAAVLKKFTDLQE